MTKREVTRFLVQRGFTFRDSFTGLELRLADRTVRVPDRRLYGFPTAPGGDFGHVFVYGYPPASFFSSLHELELAIIYHSLRPLQPT